VHYRIRTALVSFTLLEGVSLGSTMAAPSGPPMTFSTQERVLCYHGPLIYEAKIMKTKVFDENHPMNGVAGQHYLVHYKGWKQT